LKFLIKYFFYAPTLTKVPYTPWYYQARLGVEKENGGDFWRMDGLTFVRFKGAGHMVPTVIFKLTEYIFFKKFLFLIRTILKEPMKCYPLFWLERIWILSHLCDRLQS
jgi:hypothetical protein